MDSRNRLWWVMGGVGLLLVVVLTGGLYWLSPVDTAARNDLTLPRPQNGPAPFEYVAGQSAALAGTPAGGAAGTAVEGAAPVTASRQGIHRVGVELAGTSTTAATPDAGERTAPAAGGDEQAVAVRQPIPRVTVDAQAPASPAAAPAVRAIPTSGARATAVPATRHRPPATVSTASSGAAPVAVRSAPLAKLAPALPLREFWVQVGSFASRSRAEELGERLGDQGIVSRVTTRTAGAEVFFRVRVGPYASRLEAEKFLAWVQRVDGLDGSYISEVRNAGG